MGFCIVLEFLICYLVLFLCSCWILEIIVCLYVVWWLVDCWWWVLCIGKVWIKLRIFIVTNICVDCVWIVVSGVLLVDSFVCFEVNVWVNENVYYVID